MTFLLDTDTCVFWLRGHAPVRQRLIAVGLQAVSISVVTLAELRYGAACSARPDTNQRVIDIFISGPTLLGVDTDIARAFGDLKAALRQRGQLIDDTDLLIAATAQVRGLLLVTNNTNHFSRISSLRLENWT